MPVFVIAAKHTDALETPVFRAGIEENEEAIAAFTSQESAQQYVDEVKNASDMVVAELQDADFMLWLAEAYRDGVRFLAVNPQRSKHSEGRRLTVIDIEPHLADAGAKIERLMRDDF